jgi:hypothetical protein
MIRVKGVFRVLGLASLMLATATGITLHRAEAHLKESLRGLGEQIAAIDGFRPNSAPRDLLINGLDLKVVAVSTPLGVKDALDRFQSTCHAVGNIDLSAALKQKLPDSPAVLNAPREENSVPAGVIRQDAERDGFLACIDIAENTDAEGLLSRLQEFGKTKNLKSLGQLRYALARRESKTTNLLLMWTEGDAKLSEMFPAQGDAPGSDMRDVPRPKGSRRLISAFEQGMPFGIASYEIQGGDLASVTRDYQAQLAAGGWRSLPLKKGGIFAEKSARKLVVQLRELRDRNVVVTISDLG